jgi:CheY-like chemotaxis protein
VPLVLIVDDNADNRELFAMVLERYGYKIELATDGLEGLACARATTPTVILMDLAMPNMDGFEATRAIREEPALASVHIIAVTAFSDAVTTQRAFAAGCNEILAKPLSPEVLAARVETAVQATFDRARDAS